MDTPPGIKKYNNENKESYSILDSVISNKQETKDLENYKQMRKQIQQKRKKQQSLI